MKKIFLPLLILLSTPCLNSCNNNVKVNTLFGINNEANRKIEIIDNTNAFDSLMENETSFVFIQTANSCKTCTDTFIEIVNKYVKETGLLIYSIEYNLVKKYETTFSLRDDSPTFHVVVKGKNQNKLEKTKTQDVNFFEKYDSFKSYMDNHICKPSLFYIDENELDNLYLKDDKFVIYFSKSDCLECKTLTNKIFNEYGQANLDMKKIYVLDFKGYTSEELNVSKLKYGLNESSGSSWSYKSGALPMIYTINPKDTHDKIKSIDQGFTFGNDILDSSFKVTSSYYDETRLSKIKYSTSFKNQINTQYSKDNTINDGTNILLNTETNIKVYKPLFVEFMNYINNTFLN